MDGPPLAPVTILLQNWRRGDSSALDAGRGDRRPRVAPAGGLLPAARTPGPHPAADGPGERGLPAADGPGRSGRLGEPLPFHRHRRPPHAPDPGGPRAPPWRRQAGRRRDADFARRRAGVDHPRSVDLLALDEALEKLADVDPRKARAMELKYFGGLEMAEIAAVLNLSIKTVEKDVRMAGAWLRAALEQRNPHEHRNAGGGSRRCTTPRSNCRRADRARFLDEQCPGDEDLRRELTAMLRDAGSGFTHVVEHAAAAAAGDSGAVDRAEDRPLPHRPPDRAGRHGRCLRRRPRRCLPEARRHQAGQVQLRFRVRPSPLSTGTPDSGQARSPEHRPPARRRRLRGRCRTW